MIAASARETMTYSAFIYCIARTPFAPSKETPPQTTSTSPLASSIWICPGSIGNARSSQPSSSQTLSASSISKPCALPFSLLPAKGNALSS